MARHGDRVCPRCQTRNPRAHTNCSGCGAVLLGIDPIDFAEMAKPLTAAELRAPATPGAQPQRLPQRKPQRKPQVSARKGLGCLWSLLFWGTATLVLVRSGVLAEVWQRALQEVGELPPPLRETARNVLRELAPESDLPLPSAPTPAVLQSKPLQPKPILPIAPVVPDPPPPPDPPELQPPPAEVDAAVHRAHAKLLRCVNQAKTTERTAAVFALEIQEGRIAALPELLEPATATLWTQCWASALQHLHLPATTPAGHYRLELSADHEPARR